MTQLTTRPQNDLRYAQAQPLQRPGRPARLVRTVFNPPFLQRIDRQLMLNSPWLWATKLHRVAWLSGLLMLLSAFLVVMLPTRQPNVVPSLFRTSILLIVALQTLLLVYWLKGSDHHHAERVFGRLRDRTGWAEFVSSALSLLLISASLLLYFGLSRARIQQLGASTIASEALLVMAANKTYQEGDEWFKISINELADELAGNARSYQLSNKYIDFPTWPSSAEDGFVDSALDRDLLQTYGQQIANDPAVLFALLSHYSGSSVAEIAAAYDSYITGTTHTQENEFNQIARQAQMNAYFLTRVGFAQHDVPHFRMTLLIVLAVVIHGALLRFVYHNAGGRGFAYIIGSLVALFFSFYPLLFVLGIGYLSLNWLVNAVLGFPLVPENWLDEIALNVGVALVLGFIYLVYRSAKRISLRRYFTRINAVALYILPLLLIAVPYLLILYADQTLPVRVPYVSYAGWFDAHFLRDSMAGTWSLYPVGWWILYAAQFAYLPAIPFLKKQYTRLNALPNA